MPERRNDRARGPRGSRRPAATPGSRPRPASTATTRRTATARPRLTGRATALFLVLAVLTVSYASSLRAWLQQRDHLGDLRAQIEVTEAEIADLQREKRRWNDPAYLKSQARLRFNYVVPGEKSFRVLDEDGKPLDTPDQLDAGVAPTSAEPTPWWETTWESVVLAGDPPAESEVNTPADELEAPSQ